MVSQHPPFTGGTINFIAVIDRLFDMLNSRIVYGKNLKKSLFLHDHWDVKFDTYSLGEKLCADNVTAELYQSLNLILSFESLLQIKFYKTYYFICSITHLLFKASFYKGCI